MSNGNLFWALFGTSYHLGHDHPFLFQVGLNGHTSYADIVSVMLANPQNLALVSDVDHQLLLKINFKDPVTCTSVGIPAFMSCLKLMSFLSRTDVRYCCSVQVCFRAETPPSVPTNPQQSDAPDSARAALDPSCCSGPRTIKCFANLEGRANVTVDDLLFLDHM